MKGDSTALTKWIIDDCVSKLTDFVQEGHIDERVLQEMRAMWEAKLIERGALPDPKAAEDNGQTGNGAAEGIKYEEEEEGDEQEEPGPSSYPLAGLKREQPEGGFDSQGNDIPQYDGPADTDGKEASGEQPAAEDDVDEDDDGELSSDSDDEQQDDNISNFLCAQFDKVNRLKGKWKATFRDGIFHLNGKEYAFKRCQAEFNGI